MFKCELQKLIYTHRKERAQLTLPAVLTAAASNRRHVYTVNNHLNSVSKACQAHPASRSQSKKRQTNAIRVLSLWPFSFHFGLCVKQAAMVHQQQWHWT